MNVDPRMILVAPTDKTGGRRVMRHLLLIGTVGVQ